MTTSSVIDSTIKRVVTDLDSTFNPNESEQVVAKKQRGCRTIESMHHFGNFTCASQARECCDIVRVCYDPVDGGKPVCVMRAENCSTDLSGFQCSVAVK
jgi:hypothetical protein